MKRILFVILSCFSFLYSNDGKAQCIADFAYSSNGLTVQFVDSSFSTIGATNYTWHFGNGASSNQQNPTYTYPNAGNYFVCLTIFDTLRNCVDSICNNVVVTAPPPCQANFSYFVDNSNTAYFTNTTTPIPPGTSYLWLFGDGDSSVSMNPTHQYASIGYYTVTLFVSTNQTNCSYSDTIIVNTCSPSFTSQDNGGGNFSFNNSSISSAQSSYSWDFGDGNGSQLFQPTHTYTATGQYLVTLTLFDSLGNCTSQAFDSVQVSATSNCMAAYTYSISQDSLFIQNQATNFTSVFYDFGDSTSSSLPNPTHVYTQSGTYIVCQVVLDQVNNCSDTLCDTIVINIPPPCSAGFTYNLRDGDLFIQNTAQNYTNLLYDFGDGTTLSSPNPMHSYAQNGNYTVCQTIVNTQTGCRDTFCVQINVSIPPPCNAGFSYSTFGATASFTNAASNYTTINYDFGDGTNSNQENPTHTYNQSGNYIVTQTVGNGPRCNSTYTDTVSINIPAPCKAGFTYSFIGDSVWFQTTATSYNKVEYFFGDGDSSNQVNPYHEYQRSDSYVVTQIVYNDTTGCIDFLEDTIAVSVSQSCVASYQVAIDTNNRNTLFLINNSTNDPTHNYLWDFGDGNSATSRIATHRYETNKKFNICLTVSDTSLNCTSTYCDSLGLDTNGTLLKASGFNLRIIDGTSIGIRENQLLEKLLLYPNPTQELINVELDPEIKQLNFMLLSSEGKLVDQGLILQQTTQINVRSIPPGIYFLKLYNDRAHTVKRIVKQ